MIILICTKQDHYNASLTKYAMFKMLGQPLSLLKKQKHSSDHRTLFNVCLLNMTCACLKYNLPYGRRIYWGG